jgi:hypothetical protein
VHESGEHQGDRDAAEQDEGRQVAAGAGQGGRVRAGDEGPLPVGDREGRLAPQVPGATGGVSGDPHLAAVAVGGAQLTVEQTLAGLAQHGTEEVLAVQAHDDPAAERRRSGGQVGAGVDRGDEGEGELLPVDRQVPVAQQDVRVGDGRRAGAAGLVEGGVGLRRDGDVASGRARVVAVEASVEDREDVFLGEALRAQRQPGGAAGAPQRLGLGDGVVRGRHREADGGGTDQLGAGERGGRGPEVGGVERRVGAGAGGHRLQQVEVAAGLHGDGRPGDRGALVHRPAGVVAVPRAQGVDGETGDEQADDENADGEHRPQPVPAAGVRPCVHRSVQESITDRSICRIQPCRPGKRRRP